MVATPPPGDIYGAMTTSGQTAGPPCNRPAAKRSAALLDEPSTVQGAQRAMATAIQAVIERALRATVWSACKEQMS